MSYEENQAGQPDTSSSNWKSNIPLNGFLLLILFTAAVFVSQYLGDVAGVDDQVAEEVAKAENPNKDLPSSGALMFSDSFDRSVQDSTAVPNLFDSHGKWRLENPGDVSAWSFYSDSTRSYLTKASSTSNAVLGGEKTWRNFNLSVDYSKPSTTSSLAILFRYGDRGDHYRLTISELLNVESLRESRDTLGVEIESLGQTRYENLAGRTTVDIDIRDSKIEVGINGGSVLTTFDDQLTFGQFGIAADSGVVIHSVNIEKSELD